MVEKTPFFEQVYLIIRQVPKGRVASYGQIARLLGRPHGARAVGYALRALIYKRGARRYANIPWQRVINSRGEISLPGEGRLEQAGLLQDEGVTVSPDFKVDLQAFAWEGLLPHEVERLMDKE